MVGVLAIVKHAAADVFKQIRSGEVTLKSMTRKDALILLAGVDARRFNA